MVRDCNDLLKDRMDLFILRVDREVLFYDGTDSVYSLFVHEKRGISYAKLDIIVLLVVDLGNELSIEHDSVVTLVAGNSKVISVQKSHRIDT
jgi:hypothetical protein